MWSLQRAAGQTGAPSQQRDVILALGAEVSSYTGLNLTSQQSMQPGLCERMRATRARPAVSAQGGPVTRLTSLPTQNVIFTIWLCVC